jgi:hypothetical protein
LWIGGLTHALIFALFLLLPANLHAQQNLVPTEETVPENTKPANITGGSNSCGYGYAIIPQEQPLTYRNITPLQWVILICIWTFALAVYIKFFKSIIKEGSMKNKLNKEGIINEN